MIILSLNCGSSSIKYLLYDWGQKKELVHGLIERIGEKTSKVTQEISGRGQESKKISCPDHKTAIRHLSQLIFSSPQLPNLSDVAGVGHRVVHGGEHFNKPTVITKHVLKTITELSDLAPLHNPPNIAGIEGAIKLLPKVLHVAVFDTAFHQTMPPHVYTYAVPYAWYEKHGIRKYGFHGTSHGYVSRVAAEMLDRADLKMVTCHIGAGVSLTAVKDGKSYATSMGFTPLEGLPMGTRSGDIDPTLIQYMMEKEKLSIDEVMNILNKKSGLLGITGKFVDRRDIKDARTAGDARARLALEIQAYHLVHYIGAYAAVMGGLDALVFTAGGGEHDAELREEITSQFSFLGLVLDKEKNNRTFGENRIISAPGSKIAVCVVHTNEEYVYIEAVAEILKGGKV